MSLVLDAPPVTAVTLTVRGLTVGLTGRPEPLVHGVDLDVREGETVGIVGESGSGKTLTALAVAGLLPWGIEVRGGDVEVGGRSVLDLPERAARTHLADHLGVVFQNPTPSLNPRLRISTQVIEALPAGTGRAEARERAADLLRLVGIDDVHKTLHAFPHELSGGLNQRVVIALALARSPRLLVADEPTTALDVSVQAQVLDLIDGLKERLGLGVLLVSHDIGVIADRTDRVHVMSAGRIVESGPTAQVLGNPQHEYTRRLLAAVPSRLVRERVPEPPAVSTPQVSVRDLRRAFVVRGANGRRRHVALDGVDLDVARGQALGIVGESGSGKTTLARILVGLETADSGSVQFEGTDLRSFDRAQRTRWRREVQYVFQDPYGSLDPRLTVGQTLREPLELNHVDIARRDVSARIDSLLDEVELPRGFRDRLPSELSGGQRQRVGIARALASDPSLVVADEPVSALDLSVQARILQLLARLRAERGLTYLFISHDLGVVRYLCDDVLVLRDGVVVERGRTDAVLEHPEHPYTQALVAAVPGRSHA